MNFADEILSRLFTSQADVCFLFFNRLSVLALLAAAVVVWSWRVFEILTICLSENARLPFSLQSNPLVRSTRQYKALLQRSNHL